MTKKILVYLSAVFVVGFLFFLNPVLAFYTDSESIVESEFQTGSLDLELDPSVFGDVFPEDETFLEIINNGSLLFEYQINVEILPESEDGFCDGLMIELYQDDVLVESSDSLSLLDFTDTVSGDSDDLSFVIKETSGDSNDQECTFVFHFKAWQTGLSYDQGFTDTESISVTFKSEDDSQPDISSSIVLNEFLPNPDGLDYGFDFGRDGDDGPQGEWVELYNNHQTESLDLDGWYLRDASASGRVSVSLYNTYDFSENASSTVIKPGGWLVVYMNKSFLNNTGDSLKLYTPGDILIDQTSYDPSGGHCDQEPTTGGSNGDADSGSGSCNTVPGNKSYARIPDGTGDWVDPIPTPGDFNVAEEDPQPTSSDNQAPSPFPTTSEKEEDIKAEEQTPPLSDEETEPETAPEPPAPAESDLPVPDDILEPEPEGEPSLPENPDQGKVEETFDPVKTDPEEPDSGPQTIPDKETEPGETSKEESQ